MERDFERDPGSVAGARDSLSARGDRSSQGGIENCDFARKEGISFESSCR